MDDSGTGEGACGGVERSTPLPFVVLGAEARGAGLVLAPADGVRADGLAFDADATDGLEVDAADGFDFGMVDGFGFDAVDGFGFDAVDGFDLEALAGLRLRLPALAVLSSESSLLSDSPSLSSSERRP